MTSLYYETILGLFPEKPDLSSLVSGQSINSNWPLLVEQIGFSGDNYAQVVLSDLKKTLRCLVKNKIDLKKLKTLSNKQILFVHNSILIENRDNGELYAEISNIYTLKEVSDGVKYSDNKKNQVENTHNDSQGWKTLAERWHAQGRKSD